MITFARGRSRALRLGLGLSLIALEIVTSPGALAQTSTDRTIVIVANFADRAVSCPVDAINTLMFTDPNGYSVAGLYRDGSRGNVSLAGDVIGPFTINTQSTDACDLDRMTVAAETAAAASGVDLATYSRRVYVMPPNSCSSSGLGSLGGSPGRAWVFACDVRGIYAHEVGHTLGLNHAATPTGELNDVTDPMALSGNSFPGLNAPHRQQLGGLAAAAVQTVSQDGLYNVAPLGLDAALAAAPQVLLITKPDTRESYYLSYREPIGFDQKIDPAFFDRLSVHRYAGDGSSSLTYRLAGLADGESFVDSTNGITVTQVGHTATASTVSIQFDAVCRPGVPSLSVSPQAQDGAAEAALSYSVFVTNTDSAECGASTLALAGIAPSGWGASLSVPSLALSPGNSGQATLVVTSPTGVPAGTYSATVRASEAAQPLHTASVDVGYFVTQPVDTSAPTTPSGLTAKLVQKSKQIQLSWSAASDNVGVEGYRVWRNGLRAGDSIGTTWVDGAATAGNPYTYWVQAYDAAGNVSASSASASVTIASGGTGGAKRK